MPYFSEKYPELYKKFDELLTNDNRPQHDFCFKILENVCVGFHESDDKHFQIASQTIELNLCNLIKNHQHEGALQILKQMLVKDPEDLLVMIYYGASLIDLENEETRKKYKTVRNWLNKALEAELAFEPDDFNFIHRRGVLLSKLGREEEAISWFDKALAIKPDYYNSLRCRGVSLKKLGRQEEANAWFDKAREINTDDFLLLHSKGLAGAFYDMDDEAIAALKNGR